MIRIFNENEAEEIFARDENLTDSYDGIVREIIQEVCEKKDEALLGYAQKFDGVTLESLEVTKEEIDSAESKVDSLVKEAINEAAKNVAEFHKRQLDGGFMFEKEDGIVLGQKVVPLDKVGIYVPGGTACYPSTVLMNAIPAKIAGVNSIIMTTPPRRDGSILPEVLYAAKVAGVDRIFKIGGAGAIAALAYGTESVPKVDKITGPGNIFVATAKKFVFGKVAIDMIAGPSEILIVADKGASPAVVAADMLSQAEHDRLASAVLITDDKELAIKVSDEIEKQLDVLPRKEIARQSIDRMSKIIVVENLEKGVEIANEIAPEHLELMVEKPFDMLTSVKNAGSIFLGYNTPEPIGDYFAGPNHTLPTSGTAKFSSPLSALDFVKRSSYIYYTKDALKKAKDKVMAFANSEGLGAHANSIGVRFKNNE
ncbi:MAG: histidinol dehydrogenase [Christensenellales bacterium]